MSHNLPTFLWCVCYSQSGQCFKTVFHFWYFILYSFTFSFTLFCLMWEYIKKLKPIICLKHIYIFKLWNYAFSTYMRIHWCIWNINYSKLMWKSDSDKVSQIWSRFLKTHTTRFICANSFRQGLCCCCWMTLAQSEMKSVPARSE